MKLHQDNRSVIQSNYNLASTNFAIRAEDSPIIMEMMRSKIYSNKPAAVVREYTTNALDEHKLHNIDRPVEITAPVYNTPEFRVRDFGKGLSDDEVREIYVNYGCSTKRSSNDLTGGLGIGCKAGFAYGSQFSIISIKRLDDGNIHKNVYMAIIDESHVGTLKHIESSIDNDLDTGVEISIGVDTNDLTKFHTEIWNLWLTCKTKPMITNPTAIGPVASLDDTISIATSNDVYTNYERTEGFKSHNKYNTAVAVMGNIGYPINTYHLHDLTHAEKSLVGQPNLHINFDIGELSIASNREELEYNKTTITNLSAKIKEIFTQVTADFIKQIEPIQCYLERMHKYATLVNTVSTPVLQYINNQLDDHTTGIRTNTSLPDYLKYEYKSHGGIDKLFSESPNTHHYSRINISAHLNVLRDTRIFIIDQKTPKAQITRRIKTYLQSHDYATHCKLFVLHPTNPGEDYKDTLSKYSLPYFSKKYVLDLMDYEPMKADVSTRTSTSKSHVNLFKYYAPGYTDTDTWKDAGTVSLSSGNKILFTYLSSVHAIKPEGAGTKSPHTNADYRLDRDTFSRLLDCINVCSHALTDQELADYSTYFTSRNSGIATSDCIYGVRKNNYKAMENNPDATNIVDFARMLLQRAIDAQHKKDTELSDRYQLGIDVLKRHSISKDDDSYYYDPMFHQNERSYYSHSDTKSYKHIYRMCNVDPVYFTVMACAANAKYKVTKVLLNKWLQFARATHKNSYQSALINHCIEFHDTKQLLSNSTMRLKPDQYLSIIKELETRYPLLSGIIDHVTKLYDQSELTDQQRCVYQILRDRTQDGGNKEFNDAQDAQLKQMLEQAKLDLTKYLLR